MLKRIVSVACLLAALVGPALAQIGPGNSVVVGSPIIGSCGSGYFIYNNGGFVGCDNGESSGPYMPLAGGTMVGTFVGVDGGSWASTGLTGLVSLGVTGGTLANGAQAFALTTTQPTSPVATQTAVTWNITSAGSASFVNQAFGLSYIVGYTGSSSTRAVNIGNAVAGTAATLIQAAGTNVPLANVGMQSQATATTTGTNVGVVGAGSNGNVSVGLAGYAQVSKNSGVNIGVVGTAINGGTSPVMVGVLATLNGATPSTSAALIADNASQSLPVALFQVNKVTKLEVNASGILQTMTDTTGAGTVAGFGTNSPATILTGPYTWITLVSSDGSTVYVPAYK